MVTLVLSGPENLSSNSGVWARIQRDYNSVQKIRVEPMLKDRRATK